MDGLSEDFKAKHPSVSDDTAVLAAIKHLTDQPAWQTLCDELERLEARYYENLVGALRTRKEPVDQRMIDEKRGYWAGARFALHLFPKLSSKEYDRFIKEALKESEARGGSH